MVQELSVMIGQSVPLQQWIIREIMPDKMCTPKPSIMCKERGIVRSDMIHITVFMDSGVREVKSK